MKHKKAIRGYDNFKKFSKNEPEAIKSLLETLQIEELEIEDYDEETFPVTTIEELVGLLRQNTYHSDESVDANYITTTYTLTTTDKKFKFEVIGSAYRKDQSICEEEMVPEVIVYDVTLEKEETASKKLQEQAKNTAMWDIWFNGKTLEEIKSALRTKKFII